MNFDALFGGAAQNVVLHLPAGGEIGVRALIRPFGSPPRTGKSAVPSPVGRLDGSCRLYLGGPAHPARELEGAAIDFDGKRYRAELSENIWFGGSILYVRATLRPTGEQI